MEVLFISKGNHGGCFVNNQGSRGSKGGKSKENSLVGRVKDCMQA